ncbi:hypothetical protein F5Y16DRAFT_385361 [Xylariaceae sp. FL0255]|nr:hypothetical protein F5Y16DRAFT_385361 [Xylariaceae sp. FL0255]
MVSHIQNPTVKKFLRQSFMAKRRNIDLSQRKSQTEKSITKTSSISAQRRPNQSIISSDRHRDTVSELDESTLSLPSTTAPSSSQQLLLLAESPYNISVLGDAGPMPQKPVNTQQRRPTFIENQNIRSDIQISHSEDPIFAGGRPSLKLGAGIAHPTPSTSLEPSTQEAPAHDIEIPLLQSFEVDSVDDRPVEGAPFDIITRFDDKVEGCIIYADRLRKDRLWPRHSHPPPNRNHSFDVCGYSPDSSDPFMQLELRKRPTGGDRKMFNMVLDFRVAERGPEPENQQVDGVIGRNYREKLYAKHEKSVLGQQNFDQHLPNLPKAHQQDWLMPEQAPTTMPTFENTGICYGTSPSGYFSADVSFLQPDPQMGGAMVPSYGKLFHSIPLPHERIGSPLNFVRTADNCSPGTYLDTMAQPSFASQDGNETAWSYGYVSNVISYQLLPVFEHLK